MKSSVKNLLHAGVFALAAVFAFAFTQPINSFQPEYGQVGNDWYDATGAELGVDYLCNQPQQQTACTRSNNEEHAPIIKTGEFVPVTLSPMED